VRPERALATVLFTDIVDSTRRAAELGDGPWRDLLDRHDALVRDELRRHDGREVKTTGDGFLATFGGPAAAIRCARAIIEEVRSLGLDTRAGIHTGECELRGTDVAGMAVHIGARIGALAAPGEVLVSGTVRDLVVGSVIEFADHGEHELKGVPGRWRVFAVADHAAAGQATAGVLQQREPLFAALARRAPAVSRAVLSATRRRR
jgi:class 3 adenylate cyclase